MRFIFGLVAGALATLFIAAAFDAPADHLVGKLVHTTARLSDKFVETETPEATEIEVVRAADVVELPEPAPVTEPVLEPVVLPEESAQATPAPTSTEAPVQPESAADADAVPDSAAQTTALEAATAWQRFHSEASANGFARRLSRETGRPFTVEKRGPGDYAVTFVYAGEADLSAMRQQIAEVTGIPQT